MQPQRNLLQRTIGKIKGAVTRKKPVFTPQNKLKAEGQIISRGIVSLLAQ
jgi:hypothetical protein